MSYSIRFTASGKRRFQQVGYARDGVTRRDAELALADVLADVRRGIYVDPATVPAPPAPKAIPTMHEFASEWFAAHRIDGGHRGQGLAPRSVEDLEWRLSVHLLPTFARQRVDEISVEGVDRFRRAKVQEGLSASSVNKLLATLSAILEQAQEYGHVERNVAAGRRRRLPTTKPSRVYLERADHIAALLAGAAALDDERRGEPYRYALVAVLVFSGVRPGECLALRRSDADLTRNRLTVAGTKTDAAVRSIPMLPILADALTDHRERLRDGVARIDRLAPDALLFATASGKPLSQSNVRNRILAPALDAANAAMYAAGEAPLPKVGPHALRRTFCSVRCAMNAPQPAVMREMGHASSRLALDVYAGAIDEDETERLRELVESTPKAANRHRVGGGWRGAEVAD